MKFDFENYRLRRCEVVTSLTPSGLGRLAAVLGAAKGENPYAQGTPQHADWDESFRDVQALQSVDIRPRSRGLKLVHDSTN